MQATKLESQIKQNEIREEQFKLEKMRQVEHSKVVVRELTAKLDSGKYNLEASKKAAAEFDNKLKLETKRIKDIMHKLDTKKNQLSQEYQNIIKQFNSEAEKAFNVKDGFSKQSAKLQDEVQSWTDKEQQLEEQAAKAKRVCIY